MRMLTAKAGPICQMVCSINRGNPAYPNFNEEWTLGEFTLDGGDHNLRALALVSAMAFLNM